MSLYRKYRPASFAEVIGQEHVTDPLGRAIDAGRIHHAFLFSGPRGCGKTSSARILARSLNCEQGPISIPCGVCDSCVQLAPGGKGNLDVVELDAASHGGVDDTRDLRDRAFYAPVSSRYRVFIIDEAHMVSTAGFNALLKIVEEPPEHVIFIFATTEPEKVIPTIRSRTHHYPFRLLGPKAMEKLVTNVLESEAITVEKSVYPLLIRAGGGSPRDTLSLLDQLIAGAPNNAVSMEHAATLLGVTDTRFLDEIIIAISQRQAGIAFTVVEKILESGLDPRRFVMDLLERHRDLLLIQSIPDAVERGILQARSDAADTLRELARTVPGAELVHNAEVLTEGLNSLRGATAPRLLLEIMIAKLLLAQTTAVLEERVSNLEDLVGVRLPAPISPLSDTAPATVLSKPSIVKNRDDSVPSEQSNEQIKSDSTAPLTANVSAMQNNGTDTSAAGIRDTSDSTVSIKFFRKSQSSPLVATAERTDSTNESVVPSDLKFEETYSKASAVRSYNSVRKPQEVRAYFNKNLPESDQSLVSPRENVVLSEDIAGEEPNTATSLGETHMPESPYEINISSETFVEGVSETDMQEVVSLVKDEPVSTEDAVEGSVVGSKILSEKHALTVEQAYQMWPAIRKKIHEIDKVIEVMLASSEVIRVDSLGERPLIVLEHESAPLINRLNSERGTAVLRKAAEEIIGYPVDVITELKKKLNSSGGDPHPKVQTGVEPEKIQPKVKITPPERLVEPEYFGYEDELVESDKGEQDAWEILHRILGARKMD